MYFFAFGLDLFQHKSIIHNSMELLLIYLKVTGF